VQTGAQVWLSWRVEHSFGLADEPADEPRFASDTSTRVLAAQTGEELRAELKE
jgi:spermidine/putrescine transport system ATP-binding protein